METETLSQERWNMDCNKSLLLHVRMFGKFELEYKGELIDLRFGQTTKVMQILQILLYKFPLPARRADHRAVGIPV